MKPATQPTISVHARYEYTAARLDQMREPAGPELCVLGRSNVGKSSFINHLFGDSRLARVSKTPGKTRCAHFFSVGGKDVVQEATWVDLPGYGYATASKKEKIRWSRLIADYCEQREALWGVIWLCDIRHPGASLDKTAAPWIADLQLPVLPVLTKADKLSKNKRQQQAVRYRKIFGFDRAPVLYSTMVQESRAVFWCEYNEWVTDAQKLHDGAD